MNLVRYYKIISNLAIELTLTQTIILIAGFTIIVVGAEDSDNWQSQTLSIAVPAYRIEVIRRGDIDVYALAETASGARAEFAPALGGLGLQLRLSKRGKKYELFPETILDNYPQNPTSQGMPILFPFAGVHPEGEYQFGRWSARLRSGSGSLHNYHGFAAYSSWRVIAHFCQDDGAIIEMELTPELVENCERQYPFAFRCLVRYELKAEKLLATVRIENCGESLMPFSFGWHPYFRRQTSTGVRRFYLDSPQRWISDNLWQTAQIVAVDSNYDPRQGLLLEGRSAEHFVGFKTDSQGWSECQLEEEDSQLSIILKASPEFSLWVLYAPDKNGAVAIEPYTAIPNAINLVYRTANTGLRILGPGDNFTAAMTIQLQ